MNFMTSMSLVVVLFGFSNIDTSKDMPDFVYLTFLYPFSMIFVVPSSAVLLSNYFGFSNAPFPYYIVPSISTEHLLVLFHFLHSKFCIAAYDTLFCLTEDGMAGSFLHVYTNRCRSGICLWRTGMLFLNHSVAIDLSNF